MKIADVWTDILNFLGQAWWVKILTTQPQCTYYFGPFASINEANLAMPGYVEDLESELAQDIQTYIKRCKPSILTIIHGVDSVDN
jgi:Domain of unknown function (DUF1816)